MTTESTRFNPSAYLKGLGWKGPGAGLNDSPHARARPVIAAQKKSLSGVGKDRDTAFPWWEIVFANVATKVGSGDKASDHDRTKTGIISHLPPKPKGNAYEPRPGTLGGAGGINLDALGEAKIEMARRELYSRFLRGKVLGGSADQEVVKLPGLKKRKAEVESDSESDSEEESASEDQEKKRKREKKERKAAKRAKKELKAAKKASKKGHSAATTTKDHSDAEDSDTVIVDTPATSTSPPPPSSTKPSKADRKAAKALRRATKESCSSSSKKSSKAATPTHLSPEESRTVEEAAYEEAREVARRAAKEERQLAKIVKRALKEEKKKGKE